MMFRAVERDQRMSAQPAEHIQAARSPLELFNHVAEHGMQQIRGSRIQHVADMIIRRYFRQAEQRLAVGSRTPLLKSTLVLQKRRALHKKRRKRRHPDVTHRIARIRPPALVRKTVQAPPQRTKKGLKRTHALHESDFDAVGNPLF